MATPIIQKTGSVSGAGTPGQGSNNLVIGETVTFTDEELANSGASYYWDFLDIPIGSSAMLSNHTTAAPSFQPDITGSYRIRCTVDGADYAIDVHAVPLPNTGARIPSFKETTEYDGASNLKGWHEAMTVFMRAVDQALGSVGSVPTLDQAYDGPSGSGSGRTITVDSGAVTLNCATVDDSAALEINRIPTSGAEADGIAVSIGALSTGHGLEVTMNGGGGAAFRMTDGTNNEAFIEGANGQSAAVSASNEGRIRYNSSTNKWQYSENTGAYVDFSSGGGGLTVGDSIASGTANRVLYEDSSNQLAESAILTFDGTVLSINSASGKVSGTRGWITDFSGDSVKATSGEHIYSSADSYLDYHSGALHTFYSNTTAAVRISSAAGFNRLDMSGGATETELLLWCSVDSSLGVIAQGPLNLYSATSIAIGNDSSVSTTLVGPLVQTGSTSGTLTHQVPATVTSYSLTWPAAVAATTGYVLSSTDAGVLSWVAQSGGGGLTIGDSISSGTASRVLYEDSSNQLAESANLTYDGNYLGVGGAASTSGTPDPVLDITVPQHTSIAASITKFVDIDYAGQMTLVDGTHTAIYGVYIGRPDLSEVGSSALVTDAATLYVQGQPTSGGETIQYTNGPYALWVGSGATQLDGNLTVEGTSTLNSDVSIDGPLYIANDSGTGATLNVNVQSQSLNTNPTKFIFFNTGNTYTWTGGYPTEHSSVFVAQANHTASAGTIGTAASFTVEGAPTAGGSLTITNSYALWVKSGVSYFEGAAGTELYVLTPAASVATNAALSNTFKVTLDQNTTLANPTNTYAGFTYAWIIVQDSTARTLGFGANFKWPGGVTPTVSTGNGAVDMITAICDSDGSTLRCNYLNDIK